MKKMFKKLRISLIFSNLVVNLETTKITAMHNLYANFVKILETCKHFPKIWSTTWETYLVQALCQGSVTFEVIALSLEVP